jgi:hypothetical protein
MNPVRFMQKPVSTGHTRPGLTGRCESIQITAHGTRIPVLRQVSSFTCANNRYLLETLIDITGLNQAVLPRIRKPETLLRRGYFSG